MDISTWFLDQHNRANWPYGNKDIIETAMGDEFIEEYVSGSGTNRRTPIDAIKTIGSVLTHEVSNLISSIESSLANNCS
jgi:hypothetical protein